MAAGSSASFSDLRSCYMNTSIDEEEYADVQTRFKALLQDTSASSGGSADEMAHPLQAVRPSSFSGGSAAMVGTEQQNDFTVTFPELAPDRHGQWLVFNPGINRTFANSETSIIDGLPLASRGVMQPASAVLHAFAFYRGVPSVPRR
eukprot:scaffold303177_cov45-Prasinocladus_malaysianus.AAC.1